jgi:hypothetical protein
MRGGDTDTMTMTKLNVPVGANRNLSDEENCLRKVYRKIREMVRALEKAKDRKERQTIRKALDRREKALVDAMFAEGPFEVWRRLLDEVGRSYRTSGGDLLFFRNRDHRLYDLEERAFTSYLIQVTGATWWVKSEALPKFRAWTQFEAPEVTTYFLAYNSPNLDVIAVNTFDGFMMRRRRGGKWECVENGKDGVLFRTPPDFLTPWRPDFTHRGSGTGLAWLCSLGHFAGDGYLSIEDQRRLIWIWILHLFMPAVNPVHPVPLHEGVTGSGKSVLGESFGSWLTGPEFEVMDLPSGDATKAEESIKLALCKRPLVVIDNVDSPAPWLEDFLCRYATGVRMSRRRLYTDAEEVHFLPRAGLIITSREPHFRREDVARRLLPIRFRLIPDGERRTETSLRQDLDARRARIWGDVLTKLAAIQDAWPTVSSGISPSHSLADFAVFGEVVTVADARDPKEWRALMSRLEQAQRRFSTEEDPLVEVLDVALATYSGDLPAQPVSQLFSILAGEAKSWGLPWTIQKPAGLTKALKNRRQALEQALGAQIVLDPHHQGGMYWVSITKARNGGPASSGAKGGNGGDDSGKSSLPGSSETTGN